MLWSIAGHVRCLCGMETETLCSSFRGATDFKADYPFVTGDTSKAFYKESGRKVNL